MLRFEGEVNNGGGTSTGGMGGEGVDFEGEAEVGEIGEIGRVEGV
jgi:hypothetical protein